jgi:N-acyl homoserine lactone hydrolase
VRIEEIRRIDLGYFVRPAAETATGEPRVEPCLGYVLPFGGSHVIIDTGMGTHPVVDARYRPLRRPLEVALADAGLKLDDIGHVVNCHLHFDHCGGNPLVAGRPIYVQSTELEQARTVDRYTLPWLVDFDGAAYEIVDGETQLAEGIWLIPTPGHTDGHQSLVAECTDGTVVVAGQSHDHATDFTADQLAWRAGNHGVDQPRPEHPDWIERLMQFDPRRIVFAHDQAVWEPST